MFISRMPINTARRGAWKLLASPQAMHAAVLAGFPPDDDLGARRVLWRIDRDDARHATWLAIVSPTPPDLTGLAEQAGWPVAQAWETKPYDPFLQRLAPGQRWLFRLTANPVHVGRLPDGSAKRLPHVTVAQQQEWLLTRAPNLGFEILAGQSGPDLAVTRRDRRTFRRAGATVTISFAQFDGQLVVSDVAAFRTALTSGIGRAKAYGCGLLTLVPLPAPSE